LREQGQFREAVITFRDVSIGKLSDAADPFDWGGDWNGNTPTEGSPFFPPTGNPLPFDRLLDKIWKGEFPGRQVDWGAWAAKVTKRQILAFIPECYGDTNRGGNPKVMEHLYGAFEELMAYVRALPDDGSYALVAEEL
jgi:hypothetical protein